jgi:signal transduction histidine kinase
MININVREVNILNKMLKNFFNNFSVGQKVMSLILLEIASYSLVTIIAVSQISAVGNEVKKMVNLYAPLVSSTDSVRLEMLEMALNLKEIIFVGDRVVYDKDAEEKFISEREQYLKKYKNIEKTISSAEKLVKSERNNYGENFRVIEDNEQKLLEQLQVIRVINRNHTDVVRKLFTHVEVGSFLMGMELIGRVVKSEAEVNNELDKLNKVLVNLQTSSLEHSRTAQRRGSYFTMLGSFLTVCFVISFFFVIVRKNITRPFHVLTDTIDTFDAANQLKEDRTELSLMKRGDELGAVARSFNKLKHELWTQRQDLQTAKSEAERATMDKNKFLAAASHDLRQPLHAMQMFIAALKEKTEDENSLEIISNIESVSVSSGKLLNSLLDVSQLEAGDVIPQFESFAIQEVFRRVNNSFSVLAKRKGLGFKIIKSDVIVHSDPILLERILQNLISNAIRFTKFGRVLVCCRDRGKNVEIQVWDTGFGIPKEYSKLIYNEFQQLDNNERDRSRGLGLGLAIVRGLSERLDHPVKHRSKVGSGTRFSVSLSKGSNNIRSDMVEEQSYEYSNDLVGLRVLLIEDDLSVLNATTQLLLSWEIEVESATTFDEAIEVTVKSVNKPEFIIADLRLPGNFDGIEAITRVQLLIGEAIPSVVITGDLEHDQTPTISELGYRVLNKPVRPAKLRSLMTHLINQYRRDISS